jgi:hypothetical protein
MLISQLKIRATRLGYVTVLTNIHPDDRWMLRDEEELFRETAEERFNYTEGRTLVTGNYSTLGPLTLIQGHHFVLSYNPQSRFSRRLYQEFRSIEGMMSTLHALRWLAAIDYATRQCFATNDNSVELDGELQWSDAVSTF